MNKMSLTLAAVCVLTVGGIATSQPPAESCFSCDTDWFCCSECWLWDGHMHTMLGSWPYDGYNTYHEEWHCDNCADAHDGDECDASLALSTQLSNGVAQDVDISEIISEYPDLVRIDAKNGMLTVLDCNDGSDFAEIVLTPRQAARLRAAPS
ncbi:MAG: hypothetical protein WEF86_04350 [Gemmatimonadota bacterium]